MSKRQQEILREYAAIEDQAVLPESRGFFEKLADFFSKSEKQPSHHGVEKGPHGSEE